MIRRILPAFLLLLVARPGVAQQPTPPTIPATERFARQLEDLTPARPDAYFLLGEDVLDASQTPEDRRLATELFVLAFELDLAASQRRSVAASACMALADLVGLERDRRWLWALAKSIEPRRARPEWLALPGPPMPESAAYRTSEALGLIRSGDEGRAQRLTTDPNIRATLDRHDRLLMRLGVQGGAGALLRAAEHCRCPECGNQRAVRRGRGVNPEMVLCPNCSGDPGPALSSDELIAQLRFESWLLQGDQRSWAAQVAADGSAPLLDPSPDEVAPTFGVNKSLVYWRQGRWCASPDGSSAPPPAPVESPAETKPPSPPAAGG